MLCVNICTQRSCQASGLHYVNATKLQLGLYRVALTDVWVKSLAGNWMLAVAGKDTLMDGTRQLCQLTLTLLKLLPLLGRFGATWILAFLIN